MYSGKNVKILEVIKRLLIKTTEALKLENYLNLFSDMSSCSGKL